MRKSFRSMIFRALMIAILVPAGMCFAQTETTLHNFQGAPIDGSHPTDSLVADKAGNLYGTTEYGGNGACSLNGSTGCGTVFELSPPATKGGAWSEKILYHFQGGNTGPDGNAPIGGLIFDRSGNLYGTTSLGGSTGNGTVFELRPPSSTNSTWTEIVLYNFQGAPNDIAQPAESLILDRSGNLFGTTFRSDGPYLYNCGAVFELQPPAVSGEAWTETVLHSFNGNQKIGNDGCWTVSGVISDAVGNLYGTTNFGGTGNNGGTSLGVIYELTPPSTAGGIWTENFPYNFTEGSAGGSEAAGLVRDSKGNLYGTTAAGGNQICDSRNGSACGMVFQLSPPAQSGGSWTETTLYNFELANNSYWPIGSLILDPTGNLYGVTLNSVYKLLPPAIQGDPWTEKVLYAFPGGTYANNPAAGVILSKSGLVGTTSTGGTGPCSGTYPGCGTIYRVALAH
jgi:uncharacterized repeat protein (TIGR03803 family)